MSNPETEISKYANAYSTDNATVSLYDELESIANGNYRTLILNCRKLFQAGDKPGYSALKKKLPSLTFSGIFSGAHKKENLITYSNYIVIDIDNLEQDKIEALKERLFSDKYVFSIWISPSGNGLKLLIKVASSVEDHALCFVCLSEYFRENYQIEIDKSGSDVCRLCFISFDEKLLRKTDSSIFDFKKYLSLIEEAQQLPEKSEKVTAVIKETKIPISSASQTALFWKTEGKNIGGDRDTMEKIIKYLRKNNKSITYSYNDWFRVALAISNTFTFDVGKTYYLQLCALDKDKFDEYKSEYLLDYCYRNRKLDRVKFKTIVYLARENGYKIKIN